MNEEEPLLTPQASSPEAAKRMRANRRRDSKPEVAIRSELHRRGYRFRVDRPIAVGSGRVRPDLVFPKSKVAVFVDGCFWHSCPDHATRPKRNATYWTAKLEENVRRDQRNTRELGEAGWKVIRIWAHVPPDQAASEIEDALKASSAVSI